MKIKKLSLLILILTIVGLFTGSLVNAQGDALKSLDIDVYINNDGSANIREKRVVNLVKGTENYIVIQNLGKSKIENFKVSEKGQDYGFTKPWKVNDSREAKTYKNGIIKTGKGYELCWGIGEYGMHEYIIEYTVTNFIKGLEDSQILFWRFVNDEMNIPPEKVTVSINGFDTYSDEKQKIWAFGFDGSVNFEQGRVVAKSNRALTADDYVTILLKFDEGMYATGEHLKKSFDQVQEEAFIGSDYGRESEASNEQSILGILKTVGVFLFLGCCITAALTTNIIKGPGLLRNKYKGEYYRDFPYEANIMDIYYLLYKSGVGNFNNVLTGFMLKWIKEDRVLTLSDEEGVILKRSKTTIKILNRELPDDSLERELFSFLLSSSKGNELLGESVFSKWASKNYESINKWEEKAKLISIEALNSSGYYETAEKKVLFISWQHHTITAKGEKLKENIYKYMNYLNDYSLLNEHEAVNVKLWDSLMIWAGFLGIAATVSKQFEKLYPYYSEDSVYRGNSIYLANSLTRSVSSSVSSANSGSGGGSSSGGGGGSSGGGSGGGSR